MDFKEKCVFLAEKDLTYLEIADILDSEYNVVRMEIEQIYKDIRKRNKWFEINLPDDLQKLYGDK